MPKTCQITKKYANNGYFISHSHHKTKRIQNVNLHTKKLWYPAAKKYKKLLVSAKALRTFLKT